MNSPSTFIEWKKTFTLPVLVIVMLLFSAPLTAQNEDPNLDQVPKSHWNRVVPPPQQKSPSSSIITIGNFDNFNLGVDFAENNMTANPSLPRWYFTAYNTNGAHHTENGLDWAALSPNFGASLSGDPVVAYDSIGNLFYENLYGTGSIQGVKVISSADNGATWNPGVTAANGNDKCWIACDQTSGPYANNVYVCMTNNSIGYFARSTDHGVTWENTFNPATQNLPGMMVCVGAYGNVQGGAVYVVTNSGSSYASVYTFYRSTDGGQNFSLMSARQFSGYVGTYVNSRNSVQGMRTRPYPMIAADNSYGPHRGRLYNVYASNDPPGSGNKPDIWSRHSDDGGATWSDSLRVNDDANTQAHHQWHPAIWCDKETGRFYVMWMDTRDTPTSDSAYIYATYSDDGGASFVANQRISNKKMKIDCPGCGGGGTPRYQGDYNGITSNKKVGMAGWTDFREGSFMSLTAYFPDFALSVDKTADTLYVPGDSLLVNVSVPEVKLYSDTVILAASVNPLPAAGEITFSFPSGNQLTTLPGSKPVQIKVSGDVPLGLYEASLQAAGPNGTPAHRRNVSILVLSHTMVNVNATASPESFCSGSSSQLNTQIAGGSLPYTYSWTPAAGLSDPAIANPVATPTATTMYVVTVTDNLSKVGKDSVLLTVGTAPAKPGAISGPSSPCINTSSSHTVSVVPSATDYTWTVPSGATITSGQGTNTAAVKWGGSGGALSVIASNACGSGSPSVKTITVYDIPAAPASIQGPVSVCRRSSVTYLTDSAAWAVTYFWTFPPDVIITSGQNTQTVTVTWGLAAGTITVDAMNQCGTSPQTTKAVEVTPSPGPPGNISGKDSVCLDKGGYLYSVATLTGATGYLWTLPVGATITSGDGTQAITVSFLVSAVSGDLKVNGVNACDTGSVSIKHIVVRNCTGIGEQEQQSFVSVYPNPSSGNLTVIFNENEKAVEILILNTNGVTVYKQAIGNISAGSGRRLDVSSLSAGIYYVKVSGSRRSQVVKVAKD